MLGIGRAILIGVSAAVIGQMGDLIQSAYKRKYGIKDSGKLLPGHGGILDRCDSWIMVFPFIHILMLLP
ncbi:Phosphatidate cytidylyltransferase [compost metagenome]